MARLLALSALAVAASSAAGPLPAARAAASPSHAGAQAAADLDELACPCPSSDVPIHAVLPPAPAGAAPPDAIECDASMPRAQLAAPSLPLLAFAPKTSPPPPRHRPSR